MGRNGASSIRVPRTPTGKPKQRASQRIVERTGHCRPRAAGRLRRAAFLGVHARIRVRPYFELPVQPLPNRRPDRAVDRRLDRRRPRRIRTIKSTFDEDRLDGGLIHIEYRFHCNRRCRYPGSTDSCYKWSRSGDNRNHRSQRLRDLVHGEHKDYDRSSRNDT